MDSLTHLMDSLTHSMDSLTRWTYSVDGLTHSMDSLTRWTHPLDRLTYWMDRSHDVTQQLTVINVNAVVEGNINASTYFLNLIIVRAFILIFFFYTVTQD